MVRHRTFSRRTLVKGTAAGAAVAAANAMVFPAVWAKQAPAWDLAKAAEPYKGMTINAFFLDRPGYVAAEKMLDEFKSLTGIEVKYDVTPYENSHEKQVLDFTGQTAQWDVSLVDVVWLGEFAASGWIVPMDQFFNDEKLADPNLNVKGFFPILLESFGTWDKKVYGLPFDNYSGFMFYNKAMLKDAGFDGPPASWQELYDKYGPALTKDKKHAFALQSRRGETQSADSFMRVIWAYGGSLLDPKTSKIVDDVAVTIEPAGTDGQPHPALGGFSLAVNSSSSKEKQAAAYLFIQWITSEAKGKEYTLNGGVSGRTSVYEDAEIKQKFPYVDALVESWNKYGNPVFRPRFPEWPQISEEIAQTGSEMMLGKVSVEDGAKRLDDKIKSILKPYYEGKKPKLQ